MSTAVCLLRALASGPVPESQLPAVAGVPAEDVQHALHLLRFEGCRFHATPEGLLLDASAGYGVATLEWRLGRPARFFGLIRSTNAAAWDLAEGGADAGTVVVADTQSAGRGRLGRAWASPPGMNLYFSLVLRPDLPTLVVPLLNLAAGVSVARVLGVQTKWPNDAVTDDGRKLAGILSEMSAGDARVRFLVLGVGVNVNQAEFPDDLPNATSLYLHTGRAHDRAALLARLVHAFEEDLASAASEPEGFLAAYRERSFTLGNPVRVRLGHPAMDASDADFVEGIAEDIRADGALVVRRADGQRVPILAGDVEMVAVREEKPVR